MSDAADALAPYDVVLLGSFGGPEAPDEVMPFLRRVTAGRGIPDARLEAVGEHYYARGGRSPINDLNRELSARLRAELDRRGIDTPLLWGNRNSEPFFADALHEALDLGATRVVTLLTSAFSCYSSCRQYREDLAAAVDAVGPAADGLVIDKVRPYAVHPAVGRSWLRALVASVGALPDPASAHLLFVTHSVPDAMDDTSGPGDGEGNLYSDQHLRLAHRLTDELNRELGLELPGELVFCSRSGPPPAAVARARRQRPHRGARRPGRRSPWCARRSASSPTTWRSCTTSTPRPPRRPSGSGCRSCGCRRPAPTRCSSRAWSTCCSSAPPRPAARWSSPETWLPGDVRPSVCAPGCCPNLRAAKPALCGSD